MEILLVLICSQATICGLGSLIGYIKMMISFGQDIQRKLFTITKNIDFDPMNQAKTKNLFRDTILLHSELKELSIYSIRGHA